MQAWEGKAGSEQRGQGGRNFREQAGSEDVGEVRCLEIVFGAEDGGKGSAGRCAEGGSGEGERGYRGGLLEGFQMGENVLSSVELRG